MKRVQNMAPEQCLSATSAVVEYTYSYASCARFSCGRTIRIRMSSYPRGRLRHIARLNLREAACAHLEGVRHALGGRSILRARVGLAAAVACALALPAYRVRVVPEP